MKKWLIALLTLVMTFTLFACGTSASGAESDGYEIAMITDVNSIDDKSFNQGTWEGIEQYAEKKNLEYKYYQPTEDSTDARMEQIDLAVKEGAKIIITPGSLFEEVVYIAQDKYPEIKFVLIDGNPHDENDVYKTGENTVGITFSEQEAGYLAGYAAVKDGYTKLGFMGGKEASPVIRYGYGFLQGCQDAALDLGIQIEVNYHYTGTYNASPSITSLAAEWYQGGTQVIFSCGGLIFDSISTAADENSGKIIGVDVDQSSQSAAVITSATKDLSTAVKNALDAYYSDEFPGGKAWQLGADDDAVGLPMDTSKFAKFTQEDYDALMDKLKAGEITIPTDVTPVTELNLSAVSLKLL